MEHGRRWFRLRLFDRILHSRGILSIKGGPRSLCKTDRQISDNKTTPPAKQFPVINTTILKTVSRLCLQCFGGRWCAKEFPVAYQIQGEEITTHPVVEAGVAKKEFPFLSWSDLGGALEGLKGFLAELLVEDH